MKTATLIFALASPMLLSGMENDSILNRMDSQANGLREFISDTWQNPSLKYFSQEVPFSTLSVGYQHSSQQENMSPENGTGVYLWGFNTKSFIPVADRSAVWGEAGYSIGVTRNVKWCESSDPQLIYPYFSADEAGGNLKDEYYRFSGGYAASHGKLAWGATLGYVAVHHYRNVDPRPRNVTGQLTLSAGVAYNLWENYFVGGSFNWMRYMQSNEIKFVNESHQIPVYQLSGLGTHYNRFAGTSLQSDFSGNRFGATLNLYPLHSGLLVNLELSRFSFDKTLRDLNKLPIASVVHNTFGASLGYKHITFPLTYAITGGYGMHTRHGSEQIFGDAISGSYPGIGSLDLYTENLYRFHLQGFASLRHCRQTYSVMIRGEYLHRKEAYAEPEQWKTLSGVNNEVSLQLRSFIGREWYGIVDLSLRLFSPTQSDIYLQPSVDTPASLTATVREQFTYESSSRVGTLATISLTRTINEKYAIGVSGGGEWVRYSGEATGNNFNLNINFYF